jgi:O-antigen/teichoic acid export membrane protein
VRNTLSFAVICRVIANLCGVATAFISIRLYNLYVTKEIYGTILVGLQIIGYLQLMSGGFRMALNQQTLAEPSAEQKQAIARFGQTLQSYFFIFVVLGGMAVMAIYSQFPNVRALDIPVLVFVTAGIAAAITFQAGSQLALLVAFGEQSVSAIIQGAWGVLTMAALWISFALGSGVWAFPISNGVGALLVIFIVRIALAVTKNDVPLFVWSREADFLARLKTVWRAALDCLHNQVVTTLVFTIDLVLVGVLIGPGPAAVYGVVTRMMAISRQVLQSLSEAAWPRLTQELDTQRKAQIMRKVDRLNAWLVGAWYGAMAITLVPFLGWLVKPDWVAGPALAGLILARSFFVGIVNPHAYGLLSAARFRDLAHVNQLEAIIGSVAAIVLGLTRLGVTGVAVAFLLATLCASGWQMTFRYFRFAHDTHWLSEWLAVTTRGLIAAGISAALAVGAWSLVQAHVGHGGWLTIPAGAIAFLIPTGAVLLWWRVAGKIP